MRPFVLIALLTGSLAAGSVAAARSSAGPTLRLARGTDALVVRGSGFYANERVRVTVLATGERTKTVRTRAAGTFAASFDSTFADPCSAMVVRALGSRGDRALLKLPARMCMPERSP
jgi:hypothetical protein